LNWPFGTVAVAKAGKRTKNISTVMAFPPVQPKKLRNESSVERWS
jgi:hypothetical protein